MKIKPYSLVLYRRVIKKEREGLRLSGCGLICCKFCSMVIRTERDWNSHMCIGRKKSNWYRKRHRIV